MIEKKSYTLIESMKSIRCFSNATNISPSSLHNTFSKFFFHDRSVFFILFFHNTFLLNNYFYLLPVGSMANFHFKCCNKTAIKSGLWRFKLHWKWPKGCIISSCWFLGNDSKKWFLINWGQDNNTQGVHEHSKFWKNVTVRWVRLWTTNKYLFMDC